jgi:hypothetical protein
MHHLLLDVRQRVVDPTAGLPSSEATVGFANPIASPTSRWKVLHSIMMEEHSHAKLLEVVRTGSLARSFAASLNCRQKEGDQDANDGNDNQ